MARYTGGFGSGLASGLTQVLGYGQQQRANKLARDRYDLDQDKFDYAKERDITADSQWEKNYKLAKNNYDLLFEADARAAEKWDLDKNKLTEEALHKANDRIIGAGQNQGFISRTDPTQLDRVRTAELLREGGPVNDRWAMDLAQNSKGLALPEGFTLSRLDRDPTTGEIAVYGTHADKSESEPASPRAMGAGGVITEDGSSDDSSPIAVFTPEKFAALLDDEYRLSVSLNSGLGGTNAQSVFLVGQGMAEADADALIERRLALATLHTEVVTANDAAAKDPSTGEGTNVGMMRAFRSALASAESEHERLGILIDQAETSGIEVPDVLIESYASGQQPPAPSTERQMGTTPGAMGQAPIVDDEAPRKELFGIPYRRTPSTVRYPSEINDDPRGAEFLEREGEGSPIGYRPAVLERKIAKQKEIVAQSGALDTPAGRRAQDTLDALMQQKYGQGSLVDVATSPEAIQAAEQLQNGIFAQFDRLSAKEAAEKASSGEVTVTDEDKKSMSTVLQSAGVKTAADLNGLPFQAQRDARALLMVIAPTEGMRNQFAKELSNMGTGGTPMSSARELAKLQVDIGQLEVSRQNAATSRRTAATGERQATTAEGRLELDRERRNDSLLQYIDSQATALGKKVTTALTNVANSMYEVDDEGEPIPGQIASDFNFSRVAAAMTESLGEVTRNLGTTRKDSNAEAQLKNAQNAIFSMGIQALAESEEYGSFSENFRPDGELDFIDQNDEFLARVIIGSQVESGPNEGQPLTWGIQELGSKLQVEETIPASVVKNMFGDEGYKAFVDNFREIEIKRKRDEKRAAAKRKRDAKNNP